MSRYHGKTRQSFDSEGTSFGASPPQSPRHPVYFVQSPSRESHDGEKRSFQSTPVLSPTASPIHQSFMKLTPNEQGDNSNSQSTSHPKPGSRRILPQPSSGGANAHHGSRRKGYRKWTPSTIIEEEEQQQSCFDKKKGAPRWLMLGLSLVCCIVIFLVGALIFWLVCHPPAPKLAVKDIVFNEFEVVVGTDQGVPTSVLSANCTTILSLFNPSKYFGIHVSPSDISMVYQELPVAKGQVPGFYLTKESRKNLQISVTADKLPLYGAGPPLQSITSGGGAVPLEIEGTLQSYAYVFSKIVKPKFNKPFSCDILISSSGVNYLKLLQKKCAYSHK